jgi:hypothetical protein
MKVPTRRLARLPPSQPQPRRSGTEYFTGGPTSSPRIRSTNNRYGRSNTRESSRKQKRKQKQGQG